MQQIFLYSSIIVFLSFNTPNRQVIITINGLTSNKGKVIVNIFNSKKGFPTKPEHSFKQISIPINNLKAELTITDLPQGEYAFGVYHDENNNGKLDVNFFNIPTEKIGCSDNPNTLFIPFYDDAKFQLNSSIVNKSINIK